MASINIYLKRKANAKGEYPIVMRIIKDRNSKVISLKLSTKEEDWDARANKFKKGHPNGNMRNRILLEMEQKALQIIDEFNLIDKDFTLEEFVDEFRGVKKSDKTIAQFWDELINDFISTGRTGNARAYRDTYNSFYKFHKSKSLKFNQLNVDLLFKYETFLKANGNQDGGVGVKMRAIRALYNYAIKKGVIDKKFYPFDVYKVSKFKSNNSKKALSREEFAKMEELDTRELPTLVNSYNYMVFSYYMGGMNFVDIMKLKWGNIHGDRVEYKRSKTKGRFSVKILPPVQKVLDNYSSFQDKSTDYIFPILLSNELTPMQIENRKNKCLKKFNKDLKVIAELQGVKSKVTSYTIRHSFATHLKFAGVPTDIIGETMGHQDVNVTRAYLKEFGDDILDDAMSKLLQS